MKTPSAPLYRTTEGLGIWPYRGKVAAVGIGHAPIDRRWDNRPETSVGALTLIAIRNALDDAGITPDQVDGLVVAPETTSGAFWPEGMDVPQDFIEAFQQTDDPFDGVAKLSP